MEGTRNGSSKGLIFDIQRFALNDGPGIRTIVHIKGCSLRCLWCANPEGQSPFIELMTSGEKCTKCGRCEEICPEEAIAIDEQGDKPINLDRGKCTLCLKCIEVCLTGAITSVGKYMSLEEVMHEVESDRLFYENSGGGVTVSGGEPALQSDFVCQLLKSCRKKGFHTAVETSGFCSWKILDNILDYTDLVLFDIKQLDTTKHEWGTGKGNEVILANVEKIAQKGERIWLRVPLIAGYNDSFEHIGRIARLGMRLGVERISLLPYHKLGRGKYNRLGRPYPIEANTPSREHIQELRSLIESYRIEAAIGK